MDIYPSTKSLPYVYICTNKTTGQFYIGYRSANKQPSHLDICLYRTSSKVVKPNFDQYAWVIIAEFFDKEDAYNCEQSLIADYWNDPNLLNKSCFHNKKQFKCSGHTKESRIRMSGKTPTLETKAKLSAANIGNQHTEETKAKISKAAKSRPVMNNAIRDKISTALAGKPKPERSHQHSQKIADANRGKKRSEETKLKMSIARKAREAKKLCL